MAKIAWIGLGTMGYPMAGHLRKKGSHDLVVYNRNSAKAQAWAKEFAGHCAPTPAAAADGCDIVFSCVGNDDAEDCFSSMFISDEPTPAKAGGKRILCVLLPGLAQAAAELSHGSFQRNPAAQGCHEHRVCPLGKYFERRITTLPGPAKR